MLWIDILNIILAILLVVSVLLQQSGESIQDAFSGKQSDLFKNKKSRGFELIIKVTSIVLSILFVTLVLVRVFVYQ